MAAAAEKRWQFAALFTIVLLSFMMPFESIVIPLYTLMRGLGWTDTYAALILPEVAGGLVIFLFRQFFAGIPKEIYEAESEIPKGRRRYQRQSTPKRVSLYAREPQLVRRFRGFRLVRELEGLEVRRGGFHGSRSSKLFHVLWDRLIWQARCTDCLLVAATQSRADYD